MFGQVHRNYILEAYDFQDHRDYILGAYDLTSMGSSLLGEEDLLQLLSHTLGVYCQGPNSNQQKRCEYCYREGLVSTFL